MNEHYTICPSSKLMNCCIKNNWFTCGTNRQYEKLFYMNENGSPIEEIATVIWLCTDDEIDCRRDILFKLKELQQGLVKQEQLDKFEAERIYKAQ